MSVRVGVLLTLVSLALMVAWNFVPGSVSYEGEQLRCVPAFVNQGSDESDLDGRELACWPVAAVRGVQGVVGVVISNTLIWGTYGLLARRREAGSATD